MVTAGWTDIYLLVIDLSDEIEIIASGEKWLGLGVRSTFSTLKNLINSSRESLLMTVYVLKDYSTIEFIENALERGVQVDIFASRDDKSLSPRTIYLEKKYSDLHVHLTDKTLHSKVLISDNKKIILGSANLTHSGLYRNYELGVLIENSEIAYELERLIRRLHE